MNIEHKKEENAFSNLCIYTESIFIDDLLCCTRFASLIAGGHVKPVTAAVCSFNRMHDVLLLSVNVHKNTLLYLQLYKCKNVQVYSLAGETLSRAAQPISIL